METNAIVADTEAELGRIRTEQSLDVARPGFGESLDGLLYMAGDAPRPSLLQSESPHGLGVRDAFAAVLLEPSLGLGDGNLLLICLWLVIERRVA